MMLLISMGSRVPYKVVEYDPGVQEIGRADRLLIMKHLEAHPGSKVDGDGGGILDLGLQDK